MEEEILDLRHPSEMASQILSGWNGVKVDEMIIEKSSLQHDHWKMSLSN
jgi:hypothetical protein